jgi:CHASE2 domain
MGDVKIPQEQTAESPKKSIGRIRGVYLRVRKPNRAYMEALKLHVPYWFVVAWLLAFASFQIWMNPFGFSDLVQRYTQDISDLLITGPHLYPNTGHEKIAAAIIDEETLHSANMPWPWTYGTHARVLDSLLVYKPKAVVIDFLFVDNRPDDSLPDLIQEIQRYRKAGVPLYFEGGIDLPFGENPLRPEIAATGVPILDPSILVYQGVARQYPINGRCYRTKKPENQDCYALALRVYQDLFHNLKLDTRDGLMEIVWGTKTDPTNAKWMHPKDTDGSALSCNTETNFFHRIYLAFFDTSAVVSSCPYTGVIPVERLLQGVDDPDVTNLASNHIIFYGASLQGAQDKSFTPVNGLLPNVFVHAMAMDNLISFHGDPETNTVSIWGNTLNGNLVQIIATIPVILILAWFHMRTVRRKRRSGPEPERDLSATFEYFFEKFIEKAWHYLAFGLALGVGLLLTRAAGLSVANWVEVVFVSAELAALLLVDAPDAFWGYLHHVVGGEPELEGDR